MYIRYAIEIPYGKYNFTTVIILDHGYAQLCQDCQSMGTKMKSCGVSNFKTKRTRESVC